MLIISNKFQNVITEVIKKLTFEFFRHPVVKDYFELIQSLDCGLLNAAKETMIRFFESADEDFAGSARRKASYYTKGRFPRTILTVFGEIRFLRNYYVPKRAPRGRGFFFVDHELGLPHRDYFDPLVKAMVIEKSALYSFGQTGSLVGEMIGPRFASLAHNALRRISRQTVRNIVRNADVSPLSPPPEKQAVETLYVQLDEKFVPTQRNQSRDCEIRAAIVYEDVAEVYKGRHCLVNRHLLTSVADSADLRNQILDYLYSAYNLDRLKHLIVSGDGAGWIKASAAELSISAQVKRLLVLDPFHAGQAVHRLSQSPVDQVRIRDCLKEDHCDHFRDVCHGLISADPDRLDVITQNMNYLMNNWSAIRNQRNPLFKGCSMEAHISHDLAALFTARPKAHSLSMIQKRLRLRTLWVNGCDLKALYLANHTAFVPFDDDHPFDFHHYPLSPLDSTTRRLSPLYRLLKKVGEIRPVSLYEVD